ncbi:MAG: hypothetical protein WCL27_02360 [Betaproteobacteria bacterium]
MGTKKEVHAKISAAEVACGKVHDKWSAAAQALSGTVSVNAFGVFRDRIELRSKLIDARANIDEALKVLDAVDWPTDADYDQF